MTEPNSIFEKPRLIITHGEKGGVGKTTVARVLADYLKSRDTVFRAFDAEGGTGQLLRFYPAETTAVDVSNAANVAPILDYLMDGATKNVALVDLGARSGEDLRNWLYRGGALEEAADNRLALTVVYVLGGAIDSVGHLKECFSALGPDVRYVIVKNLGVASRFEVYDGSKIRAELIRAGASEIVFPPLDPTVYQSVDKASISFADFAENQGGQFSYTERRYCRSWLRDCYAALEGASQFLR